MAQYCRVRIGAASEEEANTISRRLVSMKLVAGTMIYSGNCHYRWNGEIVEKVYRNIGAFSLMKHKDAIIHEVKEIHSDVVPIIAFNAIDGNGEFLQWIEDSLI